MSVFEDLVSSIGENISSYASSVWNNFLRQAERELNGLAEYYLLGDKKVTMLNSNLVYIKDSMKAVNGETELNTGRSKFVYYTGAEGDEGSLTGNAKTILADPSNDVRKDVGDSFHQPSINTVNGQWDDYHTEEVYGEHEEGRDNYISLYDTMDTLVNSIQETDNYDLVSRTNRWMRGVMKDEEDKYISKRFNNTISRFHTKSYDGDIDELERTYTTSSFSRKYGVSHGRNLLKETPDKVHGYTNPYCRVWTWHHQYQKFVKDTMRPFSGVGETELDYTYNWSTFRSVEGLHGLDGGFRLGLYGAMSNGLDMTNGLVNITPTSDELITPKQCMFSIENLAWKGNTFNLSEEQIGPLGGRIMWFPPYDLKFNEQTSANWERNVFIGRGEPMYTYSNTERSGQLSFKLLIDHPAILDYWDRRDEEMGGDGNGNVDDIKSKEQELLRFFAGCSILKAKERKKIEPTPPTPVTPTPLVSATTISKTLQFFVFFPNNYSGKDDGFDGNKAVNPVDYLMNGVGTQKRYNSGQPSTPEDFGIDMATNVKWNNKTVGGYEMRDVGVSLITTATTNNSITTVDLGGTSTVLMKMFDESKKKGTPTDCSSMTTAKQNEWHKGRYYYRADKSTLNQVLVGTGATSYIDKSSSKLNSTGYEQIYDYFTISDTANTCSFADVYAAVCSGKCDAITDCVNTNNVAILADILGGNKGKITEIICKGRASSQANNESQSVNKSRNTTLATERAKTIQKWLKKNIKNLDGVNFSIAEHTDTNKKSNQTDSSDYYAKINRFVFVEIHYTQSDEEEVNKTNAEITEANKIYEDSNVWYDNGDGTYTRVDELEAYTADVAEKTINGRYDNEHMFFDRLKDEDPFVFKMISDKIKYFDPIFHSMSPEGFNARLTFLQQCMRQGPTMGNTETGSSNANNLAFGMAPVCVLRVGDFYNTKVIISNINIDYDPMTWDLNQEGIGVMPMIANVTLSFNFIGGSELGGPISRLQNALSFNYYANSSVYDNRAEQIEYGDEGEINAFLPFAGNATIFTDDDDSSVNINTENESE